MATTPATPIPSFSLGDPLSKYNNMLNTLRSQVYTDNASLCSLTDRVDSADLGGMSSRITTAQNRADSAYNLANTANTTADSAKSVADNAKSLVDTAKTAADAVKSVIDEKIPGISNYLINGDFSIDQKYNNEFNSYTGKVYMMDGWTGTSDTSRVASSRDSILCSDFGSVQLYYNGEYSGIKQSIIDQKATILSEYHTATLSVLYRPTITLNAELFFRITITVLKMNSWTPVEYKRFDIYHSTKENITDYNNFKKFSATFNLPDYQIHGITVSLQLVNPNLKEYSTTGFITLYKVQLEPGNISTILYPKMCHSYYQTPVFPYSNHILELLQCYHYFYRLSGTTLMGYLIFDTTSTIKFVTRVIPPVPMRYRPSLSYSSTNGYSITVRGIGSSANNFSISNPISIKCTNSGRDHTDLEVTLEFTRNENNVLPNGSYSGMWHMPNNTYLDFAAYNEISNY